MLDDLPVRPPVSPMLAKAAKELPPAGKYLYEPKWDGFRCIIFRAGDEVELGSRNERPLTRYFPEVVAAARLALPPKCVVDGEIVIAGSAGLDFDALLNRIHPADSRVRMLAEKTPASFVGFDLLAADRSDLRAVPFEERRRRLQEVMASARPPVHLTPATLDREEALDWFHRFEGAGLDGVVAKPLDVTYREGERAMIKVKHERTADVVVAGYRWHKSGGVVGSLLLGLYRGEHLEHIGVAASFTTKRRAELVDELAPLVVEDPSQHPWGEWAVSEAHQGRRLPGSTSRWNAGKDLSFVLLRPERVVEVTYDHLQGGRLRHTAQFQRWRPDRDPTSCTYDQLDVAVPSELGEVFRA